MDFEFWKHFALLVFLFKICLLPFRCLALKSGGFSPPLPLQLLSLFPSSVVRTRPASRKDFRPFSVQLQPLHPFPAPRLLPPPPAPPPGQGSGDQLRPSSRCPVLMAAGLHPRLQIPRLPPPPPPPPGFLRRVHASAPAPQPRSDPGSRVPAGPVLQHHLPAPLHPPGRRPGAGAAGPPARQLLLRSPGRPGGGRGRPGAAWGPPSSLARPGGGGRRGPVTPQWAWGAPAFLPLGPEPRAARGAQAQVPGGGAANVGLGTARRLQSVSHRSVLAKLSDLLHSHTNSAGTCLPGAAPQQEY